MVRNNRIIARLEGNATVNVAKRTYDQLVPLAQVLQSFSQEVPLAAQELGNGTLSFATRMTALFEISSDSEDALNRLQELVRGDHAAVRERAMLQVGRALSHAEQALAALKDECRSRELPVADSVIRLERQLEQASCQLQTLEPGLVW